MALLNARTMFLPKLITILIFCLTNYTKAQSRTGLAAGVPDLTVAVGKTESFLVYALGPLQQNIQVTLVEQHEGLVRLNPQTFDWTTANTEQVLPVDVTGLKPGRLEITARSVPDIQSIVADLFIRITVANSEALVLISLLFGWVYFVAWSISFYPQIYTNYQRKSVVGLNFDFVILNIVGFTLYSAFNCGLYFIPEIQEEYANRYPRGVNPVMLNDIVFSLHAMFATIITIIQCYIYERGDQRVSRVACGILAIFAVVIVVSLGLALGKVIHWLDFLYYCSYVKLTITIIKYVPQALMNYRRKSTTGWSIGNILLDFTGGTLSMLQMILNAYNYDDWVSLFGDPTKFGLGLFSVLFDIFFMLQHYVFYRNNEHYDTLHGINVHNPQPADNEYVEESERARTDTIPRDSAAI